MQLNLVRPIMSSSSKQTYSTRLQPPPHCLQNNNGFAQLQLSQTQDVLGIYLKTSKLEGGVCLQISQIGRRA